jgi:urease accessory protein
MLEIRDKVQTGEVTSKRALGHVSEEATLTLPFEERQRTRRRVALSTGEQAVLLTPRGTLLRGGDVLSLSDGRFVRVVAAPEDVSTVHSSQPRSLARAAYHLGNRHVALEVGEGFVRYLHDHVLDDMVRELGLEVVVERAAFEPEGGAYAGGHSHSHGEGETAGHGHGRGKSRVEIGTPAGARSLLGEGEK